MRCGVQVAECAFDNGDCQAAFLDAPDADTYTERSVYTAIIFPQTDFGDGGDCPKILSSDSSRPVYDFGEYTRDKVIRPDHDIISGWESTGEPKYIDRCYSSYRFGHFKASYKNTDDRDMVTFSFDCSDPFCESGCTTVDIGNDECQQTNSFTVWMKWENAAGPSALSLMMLASLMAFFVAFF